ncbi:prefoldin subunit 6-like [Oscarella lobularis]|uniref:prefoldin subunit 6-like n=1 Tax=Oscarella lobularis TaxID=121494 RepID=UPI0033143641
MAGKHHLKELEKELQEQLDKFKKIQRELQKVVSSRQQLETQKKESEIVKEELDYLEDGTNVYKLVGPALIKQELAEAKATVLKRLEYIGGEIERVEKTIKDVDKRLHSNREKVMKLQSQCHVAQQAHQRKQQRS